MNEHYPRIRNYMENGFLFLRDGVSFCFYLRRPHREIASAVRQALDIYAQTVGVNALQTYNEMGLYWQPLDEAAWAEIRHSLLENSCALSLHDVDGTQGRYYIRYRGRDLNNPSLVTWPNEVNFIAFGLPTEYLEEHGPERARRLALDLAEPLPFNSGHAGLSFNGELDIAGLDNRLHEYCFRYPGLDIHANFLGVDAMHLGTRVRGPAWMTFLGQPVLGELGGVEGLRARLRAPGTTVEAMSGDRAVITLGEWPEAGDTERGLTLPAYRELARVLEPWLFRRGQSAFTLSEEETKRWENRFFD